MAHKVQPCNQHSPSLAEIPFGKLMQKAFKPTQDDKLDSASSNLNTLLPEVATYFVKEKQKHEYTAAPESRLGQETHSRSSTLNEGDLEFSEKQLKKAWDGLNRDQRELLGLYVAEGLSCAQIAERKQQSHASIRRALSNAYARLLLQVDHV